MALLKIALLLFISLEAQTSALSIDGLQNVPEAPGANGDVCQDCVQIFQLLADMLSNTDLQKKIMDDIEYLCKLLPGAAAKICDDEVEKIVPVVVNIVTVVVKPEEVCKVIGLCSGSCDTQEKMLRYFVKEAFQVAMTSENPATQCSLCMLIVKTLEDLLPKETTESAVIDLLEEVCHILPPSYQNQCEVVVGRFTKTVLDAIMAFATPQTVCALIHMCKGQEAPVVDPCTLATYRCRDMKTALRCGTVFYCQKFAWKSLQYNTL